MMDLVKFKSMDAIRFLASVSFAAVGFLPDHLLRTGFSLLTTTTGRRERASGCFGYSISSHFWCIQLEP